MPTKESRELYLIQRFLPELIKEDRYTISQPAPPFPDVIITLDRKKIGIEITTLILDKEIKRRESHQDTILTTAQKKFEDNFKLPLHVTIGFNEIANWKQINLNSLANFITEAVSNQITNIKDTFLHDKEFNIKLKDIKNSHIRDISIFYSPKLTTPCWSPISTFWVPEAPIDKIQDIINRKDKNINGYLRGCDEAWLLILETCSPSSYFDRYDRLDHATFRSNFTRTLIGRVPTGKILELQTTSA